MKKSDLRAIILEELEKSNASLLTEKFASQVVAGINKRIVGDGGRSSTDLWTATSNTYGIAWDKVKDEHVATGANPRRNILNIFFVADGTENPYDDNSYGSKSFWRGGLLGIAVGKKVIGFSGKYVYKDKEATKKNKRINKDPHNTEKAGIGVDVKVWNYKRMVEIATEVFSIDLDAVQNWNREVQSLRADQKSGAIAMQKNDDVLKGNKARYKKAIKDIRDAGVEGKELDIVMAHLEEAENTLTKELKQKIKDTRNGIVYPGWDNPFDLAVALHRDMVKKFEDFQRYAKQVKDDESDKERKGRKSWYRDYLTEIAHDVKELKAAFDKRIAKAMEQKQVVIDESVLPKTNITLETINEVKVDRGENKPWALYLDGKKIKTFKTKRPCVIAYNKIVNGDTDFEEVGMKVVDESVVTEAKFDKKKLMKSMKKDDGVILANGKEYIVYKYDNGNDENDEMWQDDVIFALDQDGGEHEIQYSDIERYSESTITEEYVESMNHIELDEYLNAIGESWNDWKNGPMTEPSDIRPAQKELKGFIEGWFKKTIR
jgi:hypothetical protein